MLLTYCVNFFALVSICFMYNCANIQLVHWEKAKLMVNLWTFNPSLGNFADNWMSLVAIGNRFVCNLMLVWIYVKLYCLSPFECKIPNDSSRGYLLDGHTCMSKAQLSMLIHRRLLTVQVIWPDWAEFERKKIQATSIRVILNYSTIFTSYKLAN